MSKNSKQSKNSRHSELNGPIVYVAMSGGVDSSVAAALLVKAGYRVVGIFFKPWSPTRTVGFCNWQADRLDAMRVAAKLAVEFKTWDFSRQYGRRGAQYMINGYRAGITPNPDVMCNKEIKFGLFLQKALKEGADYIATGHYARISPEVRPQETSPSSHLKLLKAKDKNKDQTYFLWTLTQAQLKHCLFPIGEYTKPAVRKLAKKFGLPNHAKKDSQGVCFVGELDMKEFLKEYIKPEHGEIHLVVEPLSSRLSGLTTKVIGTHEGAAYYTIGQRHGLNITIGGGPYYVVKKEKNTIYVDKFRMTNVECRINDLNWINVQKFPVQASVKIRYRTEEIPATVFKNGEIKFKKNVFSVTPGQSAVIYSGQEVLGGGIFQSSPPVGESA